MNFHLIDVLQMHGNLPLKSKIQKFNCSYPDWNTQITTPLPTVLCHGAIHLHFKFFNVKVRKLLLHVPSNCAYTFLAFFCTVV